MKEFQRNDEGSDYASSKEEMIEEAKKSMAGALGSLM